MRDGDWVYFCSGTGDYAAPVTRGRAHPTVPGRACGTIAHEEARHEAGPYETATPSLVCVVVLPARRLLFPGR